MSVRRPLGVTLAASLVAVCTIVSLAFVFGNVFGSTSADRPFSIAGWLLVAVLGIVAFRQLVRRASNAAVTVRHWGMASLAVALGLPLVAAPSVSLGAILLSAAIGIALFFVVVWPLVRYIRKHTVPAA